MIPIVRKGGSLPFEFDRDGESIDGWACTIEVKKFPDSTADVSRVVTPTDSKWKGFLTPAETAALDVGLYHLTALLTNATTGEDEPITKRFHVARPWG